MHDKKRRLLIVGGVAGGASCAVRVRRLDENIDIIVFERGPFVSFANCGLPYYIGGIIEKEEDLIVASPKMFETWFNIRIRVDCEVLRIDRRKKRVKICNLKTGEFFFEFYDALVLSPGAFPVKLPIQGADLPGVFTLRDIADASAIIDWIKESNTKQAAVVGAGFIGLEMTENFLRRGLDVSVIEMTSQVMPNLDSEISAFLQFHLENKKVKIYLDEILTRIDRTVDGQFRLFLNSGKIITSDLVLLSTGVRLENKLAVESGVVVSENGGICVDEQMRTSDPNIWAVGDVVELKNFVSSDPIQIALAGPANRQGRIAANSICSGNCYGVTKSIFRGVQSSFVCGIMGMTVASTGLTEKKLKTMAHKSNFVNFHKVYVHPDNHAGYYPGAKTLTIKLIFSAYDGLILGAQGVGLAGVEKRIDVISSFIQKGGTVFDLEEAELCYAPQYGSAKDPVNVVGMVAANVLNGYVTSAHWEDMSRINPVVLDVREEFEYRKGHLDLALNIPLSDLRRRMGELPKDRDIWVHCFVGKRSYFACRILTQNGFNVKNISGGYLIFLARNGFKSKRGEVSRPIS